MKSPACLPELDELPPKALMLGAADSGTTGGSGRAGQGDGGSSDRSRGHCVSLNTLSGRLL